MQEKTEAEESEGDVTSEELSERSKAVLRKEKRTLSQAVWGPPEVRKGKKTDSPLEPP